MNGIFFDADYDRVISYSTSSRKKVYLSCICPDTGYHDNISIMLNSVCHSHNTR